MELLLGGNENIQNFYKESINWKEQEGGGRILLKRILGRQVVGVGGWWNRLRIMSNDGLCHQRFCKLEFS
jgi:hypothetical protein